MTSKLTNRIMKMEKRTAPVDISKWMHTPVREMPDWVVISIVLDRQVSPAEADRLNEDDGFWRRIESLCAVDVESDEWDAICSDLVVYVERILLGSQPPVSFSKRVH